MALSDTEIQQYREEGYVLVRTLFEKEELLHWSDYFESLVKQDEPLSRGMVLMRDVMVAKKKVEPLSDLHAINKLMNFEDDPVLYGYVEHPNLVEAARDLVGEDLYSLVTNVFNKPPGVDGRHPLHQDLRYFRMRPSNLIVAAWTAISLANEETGCLDVVPKSHLGPLLDHELPQWEDVNFAFYGVKEHHQYKHVALEMEPGDTVFFHPLLLHGSGRNVSSKFRRSISTHYASTRCISPAPDWKLNDRVRSVSGS